MTGAHVPDWGAYLNWVWTTSTGRRAYIANLHIEKRAPRDPPGPFVHPHPMQVEAQPAYEDPAVTQTIDVKARQVGRSTQEAANQQASAHAAPFPYKVLIATNHQSTTDSSMRRYRVFVDHMASGLKRHGPVRLNLSKNSVIFERNDALIQHVTVGGSTEAKSWNYHAVVCEEMGKWVNARTNWASIQATVPDNCPTHIISTPTGPGTLYAEKVRGARRAVALGDKSVRVNFWPWYRHPEYQTTPPDGWEPDQEEVAYAEDIGLQIADAETLARLYWRRQKISGPRGVGLEEFRKDYPSNLDEGFLAWEGGWFDIAWLNHLITLQEAADNPAGEIRFYRRPDVTRSYCIGVDPSWCNGGDFAVAIVLDDLGRMCAVLTSRFGGEVDFSRKVSTLARMYGGALTLVESNAIGKQVIRLLYDEGVNLWRDTSSGHPKDWVTTGGSREAMLSQLRQEVNVGALLIPDLETLREMTHFREHNGRLQGQDGHTDDHVLALGLAARARRDLPTVETRQYRPTRGRSALQQRTGRIDPHALARMATP